jgi:hypothetical protein
MICSLHVPLLKPEEAAKSDLHCKSGYSAEESTITWIQSVGRF